MEHSLTPRDVGVIGRSLHELAIRPGVTETGASASMALLGPFNECTLGGGSAGRVGGNPDANLDRGPLTA